MQHVLKNACVNGQITDIVCENGIIASVGHTDCSGQNLDGAQVFPGLLDIHTHGCSGHDCMDGNLAAIARFQLAHGVTAFLPTTMTADMADICRTTATVPTVSDGAVVLGFHMEGPYLAAAYKGAQKAALLKAPNLDEFMSVPNIRLVTLAPELPGAMDFIRECGCPTFLGHTACDYDTALAAFEAGAVGLTHVFNAMSPLNHRRPGPIGAAFDSRAYVQVIGDGVHLHPATVRLLYRLFGPERMILISDSMPATGVADGTYTFGGQQTTVTNGEARLPDGTLAGSTVTLFDCVQRVIGMGIPAADAFRMAAETPARLLGEKRGRIAPGYAAEFVVTDEAYRLRQVIRFPL